MGHQGRGAVTGGQAAAWTVRRRYRAAPTTRWPPRRASGPRSGLGPRRLGGDRLRDLRDLPQPRRDPTDVEATGAGTLFRRDAGGPRRRLRALGVAGRCGPDPPGTGKGSGLRPRRHGGSATSPCSPTRPFAASVATSIPPITPSCPATTPTARCWPSSWCGPVPSCWPPSAWCGGGVAARRSPLPEPRTGGIQIHRAHSWASG